MRIANKTHRTASIAAAVIMLIVLLLGTASNVFTLISFPSTAQNLMTVVNLVIRTLTNILLIVALFRGKKDILAGIFMIVAALPVITGIISGVFSIISSFAVYNSMMRGIAGCMIAANMIRILANLLNVVFYVLLAVECFAPGQISGSKLRASFLILPCMNILLIAVATMVQQLYVLVDYDFGYYLSVALVPAVISAVLSVGTIIMGIAFSIPVYEQGSSGYGTQKNYNLY